MQNWSGEENEAMKGYIILATKYLNDSYKVEGYNGDVISETVLQQLLYSLRRACDDMTADEAQKYYLKGKFF